MDGFDRHWRTEAYGRDIALVAWSCWKGIKPAPNARLAFHLEEFSLPKKERHKDFLKNDGLLANLLAKSLDAMLEKLFPEQTHSHLLRIGDLVVIGVPGELTAELGTALVGRAKAAMEIGPKGPKVDIVIGGLADEWISYMLSEAEYQHGGYEATVSFYGPKLGATVVEAAARGAAKVK